MALFNRDDYELLQKIDNMTELYSKIHSNIIRDDPYAIFLYSSFSLPDWNESEEEFDNRRYKLLTKASKLGLGEATYQLACCFIYEEVVSYDKNEAIRLAEKSMKQGYEPAKVLLEQLN